VFVVYRQHESSICFPRVSIMVLQIIDSQMKCMDVEETRDEVRQVPGIRVEHSIILHDISVGCPVVIVDVVNVVVMVSKRLGYRTPDNVVDVVLTFMAHRAARVALKSASCSPCAKPSLP
jgi:hypothetical protein